MGVLRSRKWWGRVPGTVRTGVVEDGSGGEGG